MDKLLWKLDKEELENDAIQCEEIEYNIRRTIQKISKELQSIKINDYLLNVNNTSCTVPVKTQGLKLSKFNLTSFNGDLWNGQHSLQHLRQQSIRKIR